MQGITNDFSGIADVRDRVAYIVNWSGMAPNAFAKRIGAAAPSIYDIIGGRRNKPGFDMLEKICSAIPEVSAQWLITGQGEPFNTSEASAEKVSQKHNLPSPASVDAIISLPVSASAGTDGIIIDTSAQTGPSYRIPGFKGPGLYMIAVVGESMMPTLLPSDSIVIRQVDPTKARPGKVYAITTMDNLSHVKRLLTVENDRFLFKSDNPDFDGLELSRIDLAQLWEVQGRVSLNMDWYLRRVAQDDPAAMARLLEIQADIYRFKQSRPS